MRGILTILPIAALALLSSVSAGLANGINYVVPYFGFDVIEDSHFEYIGMNVALASANPKAGFLLQGFAGFGGYNYESSGPRGASRGRRDLASWHGRVSDDDPGLSLHHLCRHRLAR